MSHQGVNPSANSMTNIAVKLSKFKYHGERYIRDEGKEEDSISLGESAKMTQVKRNLNMAMHEKDTDYNSDEHDNNRHEHDHEEHSGEQVTSDTGTRYTDVSTAQSNIAEQAEIAERRELEEMKQQIGEEGGTETVLKFVLEKLTMLQIGIKEVKSEQTKLSTKVEELEKESMRMKRANTFSINELQEVANNNFKIIQTVIKQDQDITTLKTQIQQCETKIQRGTMTIDGLKKEEDEDLRCKITDFLKDKMKIGKRIELRTTYRLNKFKVAFQLVDPNDIGVIFKHAKNLKGQQNEDKKYFRINELLPDHQQEEKTRVRDIKKENSRMPFTYQATLSTQKGKLYIGENEERTQWTEEVKPNPAKSYLLMHKIEEDMLDQLQLITGPTKEHEGSKFLSYAAVVGSVSNVQLIYKKLKSEHQMATHVMGAYRIFGKEHYRLQSFCDDGEYGAGRRMLNILKEQGLYNIAIFIVRYKDGGNIGKARFEITSELSKLVLVKMPHLDRGLRQNEEDKQLAEALKAAVTWKRKEPQES